MAQTMHNFECWETPTATPTKQCIKTKAYKRTRTESFLQSLSKYESAMETCVFFEREVHHLITNEIDVKSELKVRVSQRGCDSLQKFESSIQKHIVQSKNQFLSTCKKLKTEADGTIHLRESFECISDAIHTEPEKDTLSFLPMLNQGQETTTVILNSIADFVGLPSKTETQDMIQLRQHLQNFC